MWEVETGDQLREGQAFRMNSVIQLGGPDSGVYERTQITRTEDGSLNMYLAFESDGHTRYCARGFEPGALREILDFAEGGRPKEKPRLFGNQIRSAIQTVRDIREERRKSKQDALRFSGEQIK